MFGLKQTILLALVGSTFATPIAHWGGHNRDNNDAPIGGLMKGMQGPGSGGKIVVVVGTKTDSDKTSPANAAPVVTTTAAAASSGDADTTGSTGSTGSTGTDTGYMAIVNKWRTTMGKAAFVQNSELEKNARKTAKDGKGQMVHQLIGISRGQVLAPGNANNFESVFVGGWLCERPSLQGLSSVCGSMSKGWNHAGQTGHADILSSSSYKNIGCALDTGIWACDVS